MRNFKIFLIRAILGTGLAALLMKLFYPDKNILYAAGLGAFIIGMAYISEYLREKRENNKQAPPS